MPLLKTASEENTSAGIGTGWKVLLFNCDCHSFAEVERQLVKAVRCPLAKARAYSREAHSRGSAVVYSGPLEHCEAVAAVLEDIRLSVKVAR
jgi:ATP-dependent Clp protease adaptor protein ClpS